MAFATALPSAKKPISSRVSSVSQVRSKTGQRQPNTSSTRIFGRFRGALHPPRVGTEAGYEWTQSEAELTLTVPLPEGTSKSDIVLQMTPRFGPAQTLVLHARFWPLPLLCGELCGQVEASETMSSQ